LIVALKPRLPLFAHQSSPVDWCFGLDSNDVAAEGETTYKKCYNQPTVCCGAAITALAGVVAVQQDSGRSEVNWKRVLGIQWQWH